jgi:hypothetical protein
MKFGVGRWFRILVAPVALVAACDRQQPPGASDAPAQPAQPRAGSPKLPPELAPKTAAEPQAPAVKPPHPGPWFAVTSIAAAVYSEPRFDREKKLGYARNGAKLPVEAKPVSNESCTNGWYKIVDGGGFICGNVGTTDLNHPQVRFAIKQPKLDDVLPYTYARNAKNGTPLYKSVPSREQMQTYEPYLDAAKAKKDKADDAEKSAKAAVKPDTVSRASERPGEALQRTSLTVDGGAPPVLLGDAGPGLAPGTAEADAEKPWWQKEDAKDRLHEIKLNELEAEADDVLAKRMVSGFYIAVDKTFSWNGRSWYKSTKGLVAPADRFWQTAASKFKGVEIDGTTFRLPLAWVAGHREKTGLYEIDEATRSVKTGGTVERFTPIQLTGKTLEIRDTRYSQTADGSWVKDAHVRITRPGAPPPDLGPDEKWIDVSLDTQTLVAFVGTRPVYATLISSGKESKIKEKDHRTPTGEWRIREKHVTTTMDGDGSAAGDLPYSIEDVPYVMYYYRSYALHGAFWHRNFGVQMSHGCVNLSPLDAKHLFFFTDPPLPDGWHGVWSNSERAGSRIVIHE